MQKISEITSNEIAWSQPDWRKHEFEIRAGGEIIGTLSWERDFESLAIARTADGVWTFRRGGFIRPWVSIRAEGEDWDIARVQVNWSGNGMLDFSDGRRFHWGYTNLTCTEWRWDWTDGTSLIEIKSEPRTGDTEGIIEIHRQAISIPDASMLILLGCYLIVLSSHDKSSQAKAG
jgi:hypothetical protein